MAKGEMRTFSGEMYNFREPQQDSIKLEDIAHHLSMACRFGGATSRFYSVAEHSCKVADLIRAGGYGLKEQRAGLMHDAHEAYLWDVPSPLKPEIGDVYKELAEIADAALEERFNVQFNTDEMFMKVQDAVHWADAKMLKYEGHELMPKDSWPDPEWDVYNKLSDEMRYLGWTQDEGKQNFLGMARELSIQEQIEVPYVPSIQEALQTREFTISMGGD